MSSGTSSLANWTPEQIAQAKKWVETWRLAGPELEKLRREELRVLDVKKTIRLLCGPANYRVAPARRSQPPGSSSSNIGL